MMRVVTFGEIMLRLAPEGYMRLFQENRLMTCFGGGEANVAVSLANFGESAGFVTKLPDNPIADACVRELKGLGVDTSEILRGGERMGIYFLEKGASQRSSVCVYDRAHSAISEARPDEFDWDRIFDGAEWFHFTGITPALGENVYEICLRAVKTAKEKGLTVSCDLNYRNKLWTREDAGRKMTELCKYVDLLTANEEDARDVFGIEAPGTDVEGGKLSREGYLAVARELTRRFGFKMVGITLRTSHSASDNDWAGLLFDGAEGFFSKEYHLHIVDRVGGGDSFAAGLIYSLLHGKDCREAVEFAAAASALKHSVEGDFNRVSAAEAEQLMNGGGSGRIRR